MSDRPYTDRLGAAVSRTRNATWLLLHRRDTLILSGGVTLIYLSLYLWAIGHLGPGRGGSSVMVVADPLTKLLRPELGPLVFTPIARVTFGTVTYLFSFNTVLGVVLSMLVGLNVGLTYLIWTRPSACGIGESSTGVLAGIPALLSGTACCGPVVLITLGVQIPGVLLPMFQFLLPIGMVLLVGSALLIGRRIEPRQVTPGSV